MTEKTAIIILAAGNSSRLGSPKQLLEVSGQKMLTHVVHQACTSHADDVYVVLGSGADLLQPLLSGMDVTTIFNEGWEKGMGNSIKKGIRRIVDKNYDVVIISVCDQPYMTSHVFNKLLSQTGNQEIIASGYSDGNYGPPTLFRKSQLPKLLQIKDAAGARSVIRNHKGELGLVAFENGEIDIDTEDDYKAYLNSSK